MIRFDQHFPSIQVKVSNFSVPNTMASNSFSICAYWTSVGVRDLDAYVTGCPSYIRHAPRPCTEASHCSVGVALGSKYFRTGVVDRIFFVSSRAAP